MFLGDEEEENRGRFRMGETCAAPSSWPLSPCLARTWTLGWPAVHAASPASVPKSGRPRWQETGVGGNHVVREGVGSYS